MRAPTKSFLSLVASSLAVASVGCAGTRQGDDGPLVAVVNGTPIPEARFERFVSVKLGDFAEEPLEDAVRSQLFDEFLEREVTAQAAERRGVRVEPVIAGKTGEPIGDEFAIDRLVQRYQRDVVLRGIEVTPEEVEQRLAASVAPEACERGFHVREIRVETREEAARLREEIAARRLDFAEAARVSSNSATAQAGGLSFLAEGTLPVPIERAVAGLTVGELSPVIATDFGYHIFRLEARGVEARRERLRTEIAEELRSRKRERVLEADLERLIGEANVAVEPGLLKFRYEGRFK